MTICAMLVAVNGESLSLNQTRSGWRGALIQLRVITWNYRSISI
jgi:hypothetical protein